MQRYQRLALVFDTAESALGVAALHLIQRGLDPLYARSLDVLRAIAREHQQEIAALVVPGALPLPALDAALAALAGSTVPLAAVVVVAPPRERARLAALRERGIRWVVFAPWDPAELRFAVSAALATGDALESRRGMRVPVRIPVSVRQARATRSGEIRDLGAGGAFVALREPPEAGAALSLEFPIGERLLHAQGVVAHRVPAARTGAGPGVGVAFSGLSPLEVRLVEGFVRECVDSFRL